MSLPSVDHEQFAVARAAAARLAAAETAVDLARADYHHAVRRLHLAGAPLREVARALGISHQRVQQIVKAGGGTWWSRVWRGRKERSEAICSYCGRPPGQVAKLIAGPAVYICDACVAGAEDALRGGGSPAQGSITRVAGRCSFCGRKAGRGRRVAGTGDKRVCDACLALCRGILDDRSPDPPR